MQLGPPSASMPTFIVSRAVSSRQNLLGWRATRELANIVGIKPEAKVCSSPLLYDYGWTQTFTIDIFLNEDSLFASVYKHRTNLAGASRFLRHGGPSLIINSTLEVGQVGQRRCAFPRTGPGQLLGRMRLSHARGYRGDLADGERFRCRDPQSGSREF